MGKSDHFHIEYTTSDGIKGEVEGGWTGYPKNWEKWTVEERNAWIHSLAVDWGMPIDGKIDRIWLAG